MIKKVKKTKKMLAFFKGGELHEIVPSEGGTTYYDDTIYTYAHEDKIDKLFEGKNKPDSQKLFDSLSGKSKEELEELFATLGVELPDRGPPETISYQLSLFTRALDKTKRATGRTKDGILKVVQWRPKFMRKP